MGEEPIQSFMPALTTSAIWSQHQTCMSSDSTQKLHTKRTLSLQGDSANPCTTMLPTAKSHWRKKEKGGEINNSVVCFLPEKMPWLPRKLQKLSTVVIIYMFCAVMVVSKFIFYFLLTETVLLDSLVSAQVFQIQSFHSKECAVYLSLKALHSLLMPSKDTSSKVCPNLSTAGQEGGAGLIAGQDLLMMHQNSQ